jgi:uncharacterized protein YbjQ (UPF0145 family)
MAKCNRCENNLPLLGVRKHHEGFDYCPDCYDLLMEEIYNMECEQEQLTNDLPFYTVNYLQGKEIEQYFNAETAEVILGTGIFSELGASVTDLIGKRSGMFEDKFTDAKTMAINKLRRQAVEAGANAIIDLKIDYSSIGINNMLMVTVSGTPVLINNRC